MPFVNQRWPLRCQADKITLRYGLSSTKEKLCGACSRSAPSENRCDYNGEPTDALGIDAL